MTQDEIIDKDEVLKMARQADAYADAMDVGGKNYIGLRDEYFAKLVAAKAVEREREACEAIEYGLAKSPAMFATMAEYTTYKDGVKGYRAKIAARGEVND